ERHQASVRGSTVNLTKMEFALLHVLASRPGIVFTRQALLVKLWQSGVDVSERTVDTIISRLRRKSERDPREPECILTEWGVGYKFGGAELCLRSSGSGVPASRERAAYSRSVRL